MENENFEFPSEFRQISDLEQFLFEATDESVAKAIEIVKNGKFSTEYLWRLIIHVGKVRRLSFASLSKFVECLSSSKCLLAETDFLLYLLKKNIIKKDNLSDLVRCNVRKQDADLIESVYPKDSLNYAILHDDLPFVSYNSTNAGFFQESTWFINKNVEYIDIAAYGGSLSVFKFLLLNGSKITERTGRYAVKGGNIEIIEMCQQSGISLKNNLSTAIKYYRNDVAMWIESNYDFTEKDLVTCVASFNTEMFMYLYPKRLNVDAIGVGRKTALMFAAITGNIDFVKFLFDHGASINALDICGESALVFAIINKHNDVVEFLVKNGADLTVKDGDDSLPLFTAVRRINLDAFKILVENGADVNSVDHETSIIVYLASLYKDDLVKYLISKGADVDNCFLGFHGRGSLLSYYKIKRNEKMVKFLMERDPEKKESEIEEIPPEKSLYEKAFSNQN